MASYPNVSFLIDIYDDKDWNILSYLMIQGKAKIIATRLKHTESIKKLIPCYHRNIFNINKKQSKLEIVVLLLILERFQSEPHYHMEYVNLT